MYVWMSAGLAFTHTLQPNSRNMPSTDMHVTALNGAPRALFQHTFRVQPTHLYIQPGNAVQHSPAVRSTVPMKVTLQSG